MFGTFDNLKFQLFANDVQCVNDVRHLSDYHFKRFLLYFMSLLKHLTFLHTISYSSQKSNVRFCLKFLKPQRRIIIYSSEIESRSLHNLEVHILQKAVIYTMLTVTGTYYNIQE